MRTVHNLNFGWRYSSTFSEAMTSTDFDESGFETVDIPHSNIELPYNFFDEKAYQFVSCYRKHFEQDGDAEGKKRYILRFEGAAVYSRVFLNGAFVGEYKGAYTPFSFDVTAFVKRGDNVLAVVLDSTERKEIPPFGYAVDYLVFGGIYREVSLTETDEIYIEDVFVRTPDVLSSDKTVEADITLCAPAEGELTLRIAKDGKTLSECTATADEAALKVKIILKDALLWSCEHPELYTLTAGLSNGDEYSVRFGFRSCEFRTDGFFLNGERVKLRGLNRHQTYPYVGGAMPASAQRADADFLRYRLGCNAVRTSHYPDSRHFLDRCDEIGLLVFTEIPGWHYYTEENAEWRASAVDNVRRMILRDRNHPSVILWGVRINESGDCDSLYRETNDIAHSLDSTRQTGGVRDFKKSHLLEDVYTYNDFSHKGNNRALRRVSTVAGKKAPYLVTEYGGHMYPTKSFDWEGKRTQHALWHARVMDKMYEDDRISGAIGWCMSDYNTHKDFGSGDKVCYHGVSDMFRVPKLAGAVYSSQQEKVPFLEVNTSMDLGEHPDGMLGRAYIFTNCDCVKLYKNGKYTSTVYPGKLTEFAHLPHPPILADDFIGTAVEDNENLNPTATRLMHEVLAAAQTYQFKMPLKYYCKAAAAMLTGRLSVKKLSDMIFKYLGSWGDEQSSYGFEGCMGDKCVAKVERGAVTSLHITAAADSDVLREAETYDVTRIELIALDQYGNRAYYADAAIKLTLDGPAKIIGPQEFPLCGGARAFWIRTTGEKGKITVTLNAFQLGNASVEIMSI